jgi:hypothetical protein
MGKFAIPALATVTLVTLTVLSTPAAAVHNLGGTWSKASIKSHCDAAGGTYSSYKDGSYGCDNGGNGGGAVSCKNGKCIGTDPTRLGGGGKNGPVAVGGSKQTGPASGTTGTGAATPVTVSGSKQTGSKQKH